MIVAVPDFELPADLVDLKVRFLTTDAERTALARQLPSASAVVAGTEEATDQQSEKWAAVGKDLASLAAQINAHPYLTSLRGSDRIKAAEAVTARAKAVTAAAEGQRTGDTAA
jgi:hypothetical protein